MENQSATNVVSVPQEASWEWAKLIRKLRWIGMDEEAQKLQRELAEREAAAEDSVVATPRDTD